MAGNILFVLVMTILTRVLSFNTATIKSTLMHPLTCSDHTHTCNSYLYHISKGRSMDQIASFYSVNTSQIKPITRGTKQDYMISVPCTCKDVYGANRYFYDTSYKVQEGDLVESVSEEFYSGQAFKDTAEELQFIAGNMVTMHLVCGCVVGKESQEVVTYTVQEDDTLLAIAELLSAKVSEIENLNAKLTQDPGYIDVGWVLFVPMETKAIQKPRNRKPYFLSLLVQHDYDDNFMGRSVHLE